MATPVMSGARLGLNPPWWVIAVVASGGLSGLLLLPSFAAWASEPHLLVLLILVCAAASLEASPIRVDDEIAVHLTAVATLYAAVVYGPAPAAAVALTATAVGQALLRKPPWRAAFNCAQSLIGGVTAGLIAHSTGLEGSSIVAASLLAAGALYAVNMSLVSFATSRVLTASFISQARFAARHTLPTAALLGGLLPFIILGVRESLSYAVLAVVPIAALRLHLMAKKQAWHEWATALTDPLTGLGNRRALEARLRRELERAEKRDMPLSVVLLDADDFKAVNDTYGHDAGDSALKSIAAALRSGGEAFRWGGDEFALLLPDTDSSAAARIIEHVRARVRSTPHNGPHTHSVSAGAATYEPQGELPASALIRTADSALYLDKSTRKRT